MYRLRNGGHFVEWEMSLKKYFIYKLTLILPDASMDSVLAWFLQGIVRFNSSHD